MRTLGNLRAARAGDLVPIPACDKTRDDRVPESEWTSHRGPVEVVLLEGWCVGARPQPADALVAAVNDLERDEDADGRWRRYVNGQLAGPYADLSLCSICGYCSGPRISIRCIRWRAQQERGVERTESSMPPMNDRELRRFIAHYERLTRWILLDEPADIVVHLDSDRVPIEYCSKKNVEPVFD